VGEVGSGFQDVEAAERLPEEDGPLDGAPDWLIEIRSPDQSTLDLQSKILHCLSNGTQQAKVNRSSSSTGLGLLGDDLPRVSSGADTMPVLGALPGLTVNAVMAMTRRQ